MTSARKRSRPRVLVFDIETAPILGYVWQLWDQTVALNQIHSDWYVLAWAAKWVGDDRVMYMDQRNTKKIEDDSKILKAIWKLLDEADVVITQNGKQFDQKKLNARFILNGFQPPSSYKHIDTKLIAKKHFGFTSNKLEYMSEKLCKKFRKLKHSKFPGFDLWRECLAGNLEAWNEMEKYNKHDVLALEELWEKLNPWDNTLNFNVFHDSPHNDCKCGGHYAKNGHYYTDVGKFQRYRCMSCGAEVRGRQNLLGEIKRALLKVRTAR